MLVADTNVWARAYLNDDQSQAKKARKALAQAQGEGGVFIPVIVLAELSWVLRSAGWERERILEALEAMLQTRGVTVEAPGLVREAIEATRIGGTGGFADHLIAKIGFANGATEVITSDAKFGKGERVRRVILPIP